MNTFSTLGGLTPSSPTCLANRSGRHGGSANAAIEDSGSLGPLLGVAASVVDGVSDAARAAYLEATRDVRAVGEAVTTAVHTVGDTYDSVVGGARQAAHAAVETVEQACDTVSHAVGDAVDAVEDGLSSVAHGVDDAVGAVAGYAMNGLKVAGRLIDLAA